jgi:hypothetical protein
VEIARLPGLGAARDLTGKHGGLLAFGGAICSR